MYATVENVHDYLFPECQKCKGTGWVWSGIVPGLRKKCNECGGKGHTGEDLSDKAIEQMMTPSRGCEDVYGRNGPERVESSE